MNDKLLIINFMFHYLSSKDIISVKKAFGIDTNTLLSEIRNLDPKFDLMIIYQNALKYNKLKNSIAYALRDIIYCITLFPSGTHNSEPFIEIK